MNADRKRIIPVVIAGGMIVAVIMILGTLWTGQRAKHDTESAVSSVSLLYLDEMTGRREHVVSAALKRNISNLKVAVGLMTDEDLSDAEKLQNYQARMKKLYTLDKFAFVDTEGIIYTSLGTQSNIGDYGIDYKNISEPEISVKDMPGEEKKVIIAVPVDKITLGDKTLVVCFMEIDMDTMLEGVSLKSDNNDTTFCNIYTAGGRALTDMVLGGLAREDNLLEALENAVFDGGKTAAGVRSDFENGVKGYASFVYNANGESIKETLSYAPVAGTDWMLTYLIRESVISDKIGSVSGSIIVRCLIQTALLAVVMLLIFGLLFYQNKRAGQLEIEKEKAEAEKRVKSDELERRKVLQDRLIEQSRALSDALTAAEEASKAKTVFLSNMSHEIRTPMNAIIGLDSIALSDPDISAQTREYLEKIGTSANHLLNLINDILDMSRIEAGRMTLKSEEFSFSKMLEEINTMFSGQSAEKGLHYNCRINGSVDDHYIGDSMKLKQVLINIIGNALKFTPEGGSIELSVERTAHFDKKTTLRFTVADTGIGMSSDYLPHIFDSFSQEDSSATNRYGSSGLGLAITKSIVEMMNGNIEVKSEKGRGTTFYVTVTLMDSELGAGGDDPVIDPSALSVLVIDDDPVACEHAKLVLEKIGISCEIAYSGADAIEMVRLRHARSSPYNLILVDLKMPDMDGIETTRGIRQIVGHESAIIIITAYRWDDVLEEAADAGVDSFIAKPLFAANIIEEFRSALMKKNATKGRREKAELNGKHILLAEDVPINAEIMTMVLSMRGMSVDHAVNGREALDFFARSEAGFYDAVLMDIRMPEMDGLEATTHIRALDRPDAKSVPIIALTANAFDEDVQRSLQAGMNAHLSKPIDNETLFETLETLIE